MKRMMIILAMVMAIVVPGKAQDWKRTFIKGDELLNTKDTEMLVYSDSTEKYTCGIALSEPYSITVVSSSSTFDFTTNGYAAIIGFYNAADELVDKEVVTAYLGEGFHSFTFFDHKSIFGSHCIEEIVEWLQKGDGYVRISAKRYADERINIILPPMKDNVQ